MAAIRTELVRQLWADCIDIFDDSAIEHWPAARQALEAGVDRAVLVRVMRFAAYTSLHQALETLDSLRGLSEELREGDPTGNEGADFTDFPNPPHPSV